LSSYIIKTDITDHYSLAIINNVNFIEKSNVNNDKLINANKLKCNFSYVNNLIFSFNWYNFLLDCDVDVLIDKFNSKINEIIISFSKKCIISKNKFKISQKYKAWITNGLLVSIIIEINYI